MKEEALKVITDQFKRDPEVLDVVMYALSTLIVNDAITKGIMSQSLEAVGIPPAVLDKMKRYDNGLVTNEFWQKNYAPIKMQLAVDDIKLKTLHHYMRIGDQENNSDSIKALKQARAIISNRLDVITTIALLWKGVEFAEEFDFKMRLIAQMSPEHEQYFKDRGI